ncbi:MAG: MarR family transcriptional regulator [Acidobacteria bacterium]|nr:MarR family transcriptional regulator [Acidobacteriota bacterium]
MGKEEAERRYGETRRAIQGMKRILLRFRAQMDEQLRPQRVTIAQMQVLFAIRSAPGSSGAQLARSCYITPQTTQALLKHLERGGFIVRGKHAINDRIVTASVTPAGERLVKSVEKEAAVLQEKIWKGISDRELMQINGLLERCLENLGGIDEAMSA